MLYAVFQARAAGDEGDANIYTSLLAIALVCPVWNEEATGLIWRRIEVGSSRRAKKLVASSVFGRRNTVFASMWGYNGLESAWVEQIVAGLQGLEKLEIRGFVLGIGEGLGLPSSILFTINLRTLKSLLIQDADISYQIRRGDGVIELVHPSPCFGLESLQLLDYRSNGASNITPIYTFFFNPSIIDFSCDSTGLPSYQANLCRDFVSSIAIHLVSFTLRGAFDDLWIPVLQSCETPRELNVGCLPSQVSSMIRALPTPLRRLICVPMVERDADTSSTRVSWSLMLDHSNAKLLSHVRFADTLLTGAWIESDGLLRKRGVVTVLGYTC